MTVEKSTKKPAARNDSGSCCSSNDSASYTAEQPQRRCSADGSVYENAESIIVDTNMLDGANEPSLDAPNKRPRPNYEEAIDPSPPKQKRKFRRNRNALACEECRTRKRRCDGDVPSCGSCVKRSCSCIYSSEVQGKSWHTSVLIQSLSARIDKIEKAQAVSPQLQHQSPALTTQVIPDSFSATQNENANQENAFVQDAAPLGEIVLPFSPGPSLLDFPQPDLSTDSDKVQQSDDLMNGFYDDPENQSPGVDKLTKPIQAVIENIIKNDPNRLGALSIATPNQKTSRDACRGCDYMVGPINWCLPPRKQADALVRRYFGVCDMHFPIINQKTFLQQYQVLWEPEGSRPTSNMKRCVGICRQTTHGKIFPAIVHMVFAISSLLNHKVRPDEAASRAATFFSCAQKLDLLDVMDHGVGIELVQVGLLMAFYLQSTEKFSKCWNIIGLTIRMAQNMGLHLSLNEARRRHLLASNATQLECEMRLRVWHGCSMLDREISLSFGRPLMISPPAVRAGLPQAIDDGLLSEEVGLWNKQPEGIPSLLESFIYLTQLYDILEQILEKEDPDNIADIEHWLSDAPKTIKATFVDTQRILDLDSTLLDWQSSLPNYLRFDLRSKQAPSDRKVDIQAQRLYQRFLHIRMLLLQPALLTSFKKEHAQEVSLQNESTNAKCQGFIYSSLATQCLVSAQSLVIMLDENMQAGALPAWWYNIHHLYSSGTLILMGQFCTLLDPKVFSEPLLHTWKRCLRRLSQYVEFSKVAKRSLHFLQSSYNFLLARSSAASSAAPKKLVSSSQGWKERNPATISPKTDAAKTMNAAENLPDSQYNGQEQDGYFADMPFFSELESLAMDWNSFLPE